MKPRRTALIIDGDRAIRRLVRAPMEQQGYRVVEASTGQSGLEMAACQRPDVLLLELDLPDMGGLAVLQCLREWNQKPVIVISERPGALDKINALDGGADDYLAKPFDVGELLARMRVRQRAVPGMHDGPFLIEGDLKVDLAQHKVIVRGEELALTPTEEALFYLLARHAGKIVTRKHLTRCIWGTLEDNKIRDLQVYIGYLRSKLAGVGRDVLIKTEGSLGYSLSLGTLPEQPMLVGVKL